MDVCSYAPTALVRSASSRPWLERLAWMGLGFRVARCDPSFSCSLAPLYFPFDFGSNSRNGSSRFRDCSVFFWIPVFTHMEMFQLILEFGLFAIALMAPPRFPAAVPVPLSLTAVVDPLPLPACVDGVITLLAARCSGSGLPRNWTIRGQPGSLMLTTWSCAREQLFAGCPWTPGGSPLASRMGNYYWKRPDNLVYIFYYGKTKPEKLVLVFYNLCVKLFWQICSN